MELSDIKVITCKKGLSLVNKYFDKKMTIDDYGKYIYFDGKKYIAIANETGDCFVEEFYSLGLALAYLNNNYESVDGLYEIDVLYRQYKIDILGKYLNSIK